MWLPIQSPSIIIAYLLTEVNLLSWKLCCRPPYCLSNIISSGGGNDVCVCVRVRCRLDDARVHPGLHVQPGGGGQDQHGPQPCDSHQQPGLHPGVRRQPAEDCLPSPTGVRTHTHTHTWTHTHTHLEIGLGNISILYRYRDMRLDIVLDFVIWHKC